MRASSCEALSSKLGGWEWNNLGERELEKIENWRQIQEPCRKVNGETMAKEMLEWYWVQTLQIN